MNASAKGRDFIQIFLKSVLFSILYEKQDTWLTWLNVTYIILYSQQMFQPQKLVP